MVQFDADTRCLFRLQNLKIASSLPLALARHPRQHGKKGGSRGGAETNKLAASSSEPVPDPETLSGHDDGTCVSAPPRGSDDGVVVAEAAPPATCTEPAAGSQSQDSRRVGAPTADDVAVDAPALGWVPVKRPRTRKPAPREDDSSEGTLARRPPGDATATLVFGARGATALEPMMETGTGDEQQVAGAKLMADAIRVGNTRASARFIDEMEAAAMAKRMMNRDDGGKSSSSAAAAGRASESKEAAAVAFFPGNPFVSDALRATLASLDASDLQSVYKKAMLGSDRRGNQNRLLISCKKKMAHNPFDNVLTPEEWPLVHHQEQDGGGAGEDKGKNKRKAGGKGEYKGKKRKKQAGSDGDEESDTGENDQQQEEKKKNTDPGLSVQAYDRDGRVYTVQLKYLTSNRGYRIIGTDWRVFLQNNGLLVDDGGSTTRKRRNRSPGEEGGEESSPDGEQHLDQEQHQEAVPVAPPARSSRKRRKPSAGGACGEGTSGSPPDGGHHQAERDADDPVQIEVWAFRSPKLPPGSAKEGFSLEHRHGALGLLLLHHRDAEAERAVAGGAGPEEVKGPAAPDEATEQPRRNGHGGVARQEECMGAREPAAATDCGRDAPTVQAGTAGGEPGDAAAREPRLSPLEMLIAIWLVSLRYIYP
jgi:hypothetical protein